MGMLDNSFPPHLLPCPTHIHKTTLHPITLCPYLSVVNRVKKELVGRLRWGRRIGLLLYAWDVIASSVCGDSATRAGRRAE